MRVLLGLNWLTESWNINQSPPGGLLRFELSHSASAEAIDPETPAGGKNFVNSSSEKFVKIFFEAQTMGQQRRAEVLHAASGNTPDRVFVAIPGCASGPENSCPFEKFQNLVTTAVARQCVETLAHNMNTGGGGGDGGEDGWVSWLADAN